MVFDNTKLSGEARTIDGILGNLNTLKDNVIEAHKTHTIKDNEVRDIVSRINQIQEILFRTYGGKEIANAERKEPFWSP